MTLRPPPYPATNCSICRRPLDWKWVQTLTDLVWCLDCDADVERPEAELDQSYPETRKRRQLAG